MTNKKEIIVKIKGKDKHLWLDIDAWNREQQYYNKTNIISNGKS